jgi:hypothetical protein
MKTIEIIGGGTVYHVRNHLALCAPAYGSTAKRLDTLCELHADTSYEHVNLHLTNMAGGKENLETNEDVARLVDKLIANENTKIIFFNPALVDYEGAITTSGPVGYSWSDDIPTKSGKYEERLKTSEGEKGMLLWPAPKVLSKIRKERKDIFLVAFKTTCGATPDEQFLTGLHLLKTNSCNLVLANDTKTRMNMIITPEQARYYTTVDRDMALRGLVEMTLSRAKDTFTRTKVLSEQGIPWNHSAIPDNLRAVVNHCIDKGAYKPFNGVTVGHFAVKRDNEYFITSKRKSNFNKLNEVGMIECRALEPGHPHYTSDVVYAYGGKPSVGGQSQRIIFKEHPEMDCIVHFHCPPKPGAKLSTRSQMAHECGSHECGKNTSDGLKEVAPGIKCVYLDNHGPNIVFNRYIDPQRVIDFIEDNFDLAKSTDQLDRTQMVVT